MIRIPCPFCGERDHSEFAYGGDATVVYPELDAPREDWIKAVERDTMTHEIFSVRPVHGGLAQALEDEE